MSQMNFCPRQKKHIDSGYSKYDVGFQEFSKCPTCNRDNDQIYGIFCNLGSGNTFLLFLPVFLCNTGLDHPDPNKQFLKLPNADCKCSKWDNMS